MDKKQFLTLKAYRLPFLITFLLAYNITVKAQIIPQPPTNPVERTSADLDFENAFSVNGVNFHAQFGWEHSLWQQRVQDFNYGMMRFQGGDVSKHTCWSTGKFFIPNTNTTDPCLWIPEDLRNSMLNTNLTMENTPDMVAKSTHLSGTSIMADLNMFTSYPSHEFAMLMKFQQLNVPLTRVEIQQESYNTKCENMLLWPQPLDYAIMAEIWMGKMRLLWDLDNSNLNNKNNNYSFSIVGNKPFEFNTQRRAKWDAQVQGHFAAYPKDYGVTMHPYFGANLLGLDIFNSGADIDAMMIQPFRYNNASIVPAIAQVDNYSNKEPDILLTEGNMYQTKGVVHGSWAAALFTGVAYLKFMENPRIKTLLHHGFSGDFAWADFFNSTDGYNQGEFDAPRLAIPGNPLPQTIVGQVTLQGHVMKMINKCFKGATHAEMIDFASLNSLSGPCPVKINYPLMYGWKFDNGSTNQEQIILFNLSDAPQTVDLQLYTNNTSFIGEQINFGFDTYLGATLGNETIFNFNPLGFLVPTSWNGVFEKQLNTVGNIINIPQYTILRLYTTTNTNPTLRTVPAANYCTGAPISLVVENPQNFSNYVWSSGCTQGSPHVAQVNPTSTPTTYTVTVTDAGGLTHTTTIVVQGTQNNLSFNIPTPTFNTCANTPIQIIATLQNGQAANFASYALYADKAADPGFANKQNDGYKFISNGSQFTQYVMPKKSTDYYIMASDGKCAKQSQKITVNVAPYADLGPDKEFCTTGTSIILNPYEGQIPPANVTYNWSTGSTSPTLSVATAGTYSVTVTDLTNTCTTTDNIVLTPISCCNNLNTDEIIPPNTIIDKGYTNPNLQITTTPLLTVISPKANGKQNLEIQGTVHIMDNVRLQDFANINCSEAAQINVRPYSVLTVQNGSVQACKGKMWKGFNNQRFGNLTIKTTNTANPAKVSDAQYAVNASLDGTLKFTDVTFADNFIAINTLPTSDLELTNKMLTTIYGCKVISTKDLLPTYTGYVNGVYPPPLKRPFAAMALNTTAMSIGVLNKNKNIFGDVNSTNFKLNIGIVAYNSAIGVVNTQFVNLEDFDKYNGYGSRGIYSRNVEGYGTLALTGLGYANTTPTFSNLTVGVACYKGTIMVEECKFSDIYYATSLWGSSGGKSIVKHNNCSTLIGGSYYGHNTLAESIDTYTNRYYTIGHPGTFMTYGVQVVENNSNVNLTMHDDQKIDCEANCRYGMYINSAHGVTINCHKINTTGGFTESAGVRFDAGGDNFLINNQIDNNYGGTAHLSTFGVSLYNSTNNKVQCNTLNYNNIALHIDNDCSMKNKLESNEFKNANYGLKVSTNGVIQNQTLMGNKWTGTYSSTGNYGAWNDNAPGGFIEKIFVDDFTTASIFKTKVPLSSPDNSQWFQEDPTTNIDKQCALTACVFTPIKNDEQTIVDWDRLIARDSIPVDEWQEESLYGAQTDLFERSANNPDSIANDTIMQFFLNNRTTSIGMLKTIRDTVTNLTDDYKTMFTYNDSVIKNSLHTIAWCDSVIASDTIVNQNMIHLKNSLMQTIAEGMASNTHYKQEMETKVNSRISIAAQINSVINAEGKLYIQNEKTINDLWFSTLGVGIMEFTPAQWATLKSVASQCPHSGGKAVIRARGMINTVCDSIFWNDGPTCALEGYYRKLKKQNNEQCVFLLSPNPAKDFVTLNYKLEPNKYAEFILYDNLNQPISTFLLSADAVELRINVSQLSAGCYFYKIQNANQAMGNGKFIIIK